MTYTLRTANGNETAVTGELRIGRAAECEIQIADSLASRVHAQVWVENDQLLVRDQRSSNGTFVNGRPISPGEPHVLRPGDQLRIGETTFTVAIGTGQAASPPPRPPVAAASVPPGVTARVNASPAAGTLAAPAPSGRSRAPALVVGGCLALVLLAVCGGLAFFATAGRPALGTALAQVARQSTPGPGTPLVVTPGPVTPSPTSPAQPGNVSVQVLPTVPTASPMAPAAYASNSQAVAAALAELNQAQLRFIRDAHTAGLTSGSLIDDLLSIAAAAFKLAAGAENLVQASAVQAGGSAAAGQVADLYAGLAKYGYAQALDAQNLRLALANGSLDAPGAAARVADYGARAWNPTVVDPAVPGNPFLPFVANPASIPAAAPLSPAGAAALQTSLGPQARLQSWIAASAQTVTRTVSFPRPIRPLGDPQDPALLASLITAAGQADGDRASQAAAAGLQRLGATITRSTGSHSTVKLADMAAQTIGDALHAYYTAAEIMTDAQQPGGKDLPAIPGGSGAALARGGPNPSDAEAVINNVFNLGDDNAPTKTGEVPVKTAAPLVTLSIANVHIGTIYEKGAGQSGATVHFSYDVVWQTSLKDPHVNIECDGAPGRSADGPSGALHLTSSYDLWEYPGTIFLSCYAGQPLRTSWGEASLSVFVGDPAVGTANAEGTEQESARQNKLAQQEIERRAALTQVVRLTQQTLETEQAAAQTAEHIATVTQAAAGTATAQAAGIFTLNGNFNLVQEDAGCKFSDAPSTSGTLQMNVNFNTGQATATFTGGGAGSRSLSCSDGSGTMHWQQAYTADFAGTVDKTTGALSLSGTLDGNNNVSWSDCKNGSGNDAPCPSGYAHGYHLSVILAGTVDKVSHTGKGTWDVKPIVLPTSGDWGGG